MKFIHNMILKHMNGFKHFLIALLLAGLPASLAHADQKPPIVVELFTSTNCPACPPADLILKSLALQENIIALSCHITYQDPPHRKSPFARDFCDIRQHGYAGFDGSNRIYTPFMVVNGGIGFIGSRRRELNDALERAYKNKIENIDILALNGSARFQINSLPNGAENKYHIWVFGYQKSDGNPILVQVNGGKWNGEHLTHSVDFPIDENIASIAVIVQENAYGRIVAAGKADMI